MSAEATEWAWKQHTGSPAEKAVLLFLAREADRHGTCSPTTREIAEEADCEQKTARRALDRLRDRGLANWKPGAGKAANSYRLPVPVDPRSEVTMTSLAGP